MRAAYETYSERDKKERKRKKTGVEREGRY